MFWRRIATFIGTIRTDFMVELERNPLAVRQGAAAAVCIAAAAAAMPVIAHRAAEQSQSADMAARRLAFTAQMPVQSVSGAFEPSARIELVSLRSSDGLRARGSAFVVGDGMDRQALLVHAALRGPLAAPSLPEPTGPEALDPRELRCMAQAIYYEARSESYRGQVAVGEVVMNRVRSRHYPDSICSVVYQGSHRATGCQFTFTCDGSLNRRARGRAWERAQNIAAQVMLGYTRAVTGRATHYHTTAVDPVWNSLLVKTMQVGEHIFYRFPNRTERAVLEAALPPRRARRPEDEAYKPPRAPVVLTPESITPQGIEAEIVQPQTGPSVAPADADAPVATAAPVEDDSRETAIPPPADDDAAAVEVAA
jgi:hypothetical protein